MKGWLIFIGIIVIFEGALMLSILGGLFSLSDKYKESVKALMKIHDMLLQTTWESEQVKQAFFEAVRHGIYVKDQFEKRGGEIMPDIRLMPREVEPVNVTLHNGDLVVVELLSGAFKICMVSTFGNECVDKDWELAKPSREYCALVGLDSGLRAFREPCSRKTTFERIRRHFSRIDAQIKGISIIPEDNYAITIERK